MKSKAKLCLERKKTNETVIYFVRKPFFTREKTSLSMRAQTYLEDIYKV